MTTEELHNFNAVYKEIEIVKDFVYLGSIINPNRYCTQEIRRLRLKRQQLRKQKNIKCKDVAVETKTKIICNLVLYLQSPCES